MKKPEQILKENGIGLIESESIKSEGFKNCVKSMKLYANGKLDEAITEFERLKPAESLRDIVYLDGVKAVILKLKDKI